MFNVIFLLKQPYENVSCETPCISSSDFSKDVVMPLEVSVASKITATHVPPYSLLCGKGSCTALVSDPCLGSRRSPLSCRWTRLLLVSQLADAGLAEDLATAGSLVRLSEDQEADWTF